MPTAASHRAVVDRRAPGPSRASSALSPPSRQPGRRARRRGDDGGDARARLPWHTPAPGPIAVLTPPPAVRALIRELRELAARHDDTAWVHPCPQVERDTIANLGQDILDAIGAVGRSQPRAKGERHLVRPLTHLIHGPVRHLIVDDAALLEPDVLVELHQATLVAHTQLWVLIDTSERVRGGRDRGHQRGDSVLGWVTAACTTTHPEAALATWRARTSVHPDCPEPDAAWWSQPLAPDAPLPAACRAHTFAPHGGPRPASGASPYAVCLLSWMRRALTAGHLAPARARARLLEYTDHHTTTVEDQWAMTAAGRDFYTPAMDALGQLHPAAQHATLADVDPYGHTVTIGKETLPVPVPARPALARQRTSRRLAGCLPHEPLDGIFHERPGTTR